MKNFVLALFIAVMVAVQVLSPVVAAAPASAPTTSACGDTYVVQWGDYLARIAWMCGTTVPDILARNPFIVNPNWVYAGQVLRLTGDPVVYPPYPYPNPVPIPPTGNVYIVHRGDTLAKIAARFGTDIWTLLNLNPSIWNPSLIYAGQAIYLPGSTGGTGGPYYYGAVATISPYQVKAGKTVTVSVSGFPANADIDYRVGRSGSQWVTAVDGKTDQNGRATATLTIPSNAGAGEYWVVTVLTTEIKKGVEITTPSVLIIP
jgi:LysM repeat protein